MHQMNILKLDLNLLKVLQALLAEGNLTRAASTVGLSQPAMSHALERLRQALDDPLFVKEGRGLAPTPRALELQEPVARALGILSTAVEGRAFNPATTEMEVRILATDYVTRLVIPRLSADLFHAAPHASLTVRPVDGQSADRLAAGEADLILSVVHEERAGFYKQAVVSDNFVCLMRRGHPAAAEPLTLERYAALSHVLISLSEDGNGPVDDYLQRRGLKRRIAVRIPYFLTAPSIVAESDLVFTIPRRIAALLSDERLVTATLPFDALSFTCSQLWHGRMHRDPAQRWLRGLIKDSTEQLFHGSG